MTDKEQIFLKDINKTGFYCTVDDTERLYIYEVINNVSQEWIKKDPKAKLLIDQWIYDYTDYDDRKVYGTSGNLEATYCNICTDKVYKIEDTKFKIFGNCGQFLVEDKPTYKEQLARKTAECEKYEQALNEIEKIIYEMKYVYIENVSVSSGFLSHKISLESSHRFYKILNIISKAKDGNKCQN